MRRARDIRKARLAAQRERWPEIRRPAANDETPETWAEFYASHAAETTAESYAQDAMADANSGTDAINNRRDR